jgi:hypothetical protein
MSGGDYRTLVAEQRPQSLHPGPTRPANAWGNTTGWRATRSANGAGWASPPPSGCTCSHSGRRTML